MLRRIMCSLLLGVAAQSANAQIGRAPRQSDPEPGYWVGLSLGYVEGITTSDATTGATWALGYAAQLRATLEKTMQRGLSVGASAGFSNVPLTYTPSNTFVDGCGFQCQAKADVTQYMAFVRGSGVGGMGAFSGTYNVEAGVTQFANFRTRDAGVKLPDSGGAYDATFGIGGGFTYTIMPTADAYVAEMIDFVLHGQNNAFAAQSAPHFFTLRAGFRVGF
jgi:hypothetical protein